MRKLNSVMGLTLVAILILTACSKNSGGTQNLPVDTNITWTTDIAPIMNNYCTRCHSSYTSKGTVSARLSSIISSIQRGSMPPSGSKPTATELVKLKTWNGTN